MWFKCTNKRRRLTTFPLVCHFVPLCNLPPSRQRCDDFWISFSLWWKAENRKLLTALGPSTTWAVYTFLSACHIVNCRLLYTTHHVVARKKVLTQWRVRVKYAYWFVLLESFLLLFPTLLTRKNRHRRNMNNASGLFVFLIFHSFISFIFLLVIQGYHYSNRPKITSSITINLICF